MFELRDNLKKLSKKYKGISNTANTFSSLIINYLPPANLPKDVYIYQFH